MQHLSSQTTMLKQVELAQVLVSLLLYMYKSIKAVRVLEQMKHNNVRT